MTSSNSFLKVTHYHVTFTHPPNIPQVLPPTRACKETLKIKRHRIAAILRPTLYLILLEATDAKDGLL